ncbi:MAG TPA: porin family protein [Halomonas sp.]|nr:porin family protein [Halomonas sp.]
MKRLTVIAAASALLAAGMATAAQAQQVNSPQFYVGGDAMFWELDNKRGSDRDSVGLRVRGGAQFNDYLALEGHLGTGGSDGSAELDYLVGAYGKGILPVTDQFRFYGLAGITEVDYDMDRESDFSYGAGLEFAVTPQLSVGADYMRYLDKSDYNFNAASVGMRYRF